MHAGAVPPAHAHVAMDQKEIYIDVYDGMYSQAVHRHVYGHVYLSDSSETELGSVMSVEVQKTAPSHDGGKKLERHICTVMWLKRVKRYVYKN